MTESLKGIQSPIRDRFYHHVVRIPKELVAVNESIVEDTCIDHGAPQLVIEMSAQTVCGCPLKLYVNERFCAGTVGTFGDFLLIPYLSDRRNLPDEYPDRVERIVEAVVCGRVVEEVWRWKGKVVRGVTWITSDGQREQLASQCSWLWGVRLLLRTMSKETRRYQSYV